MELLPPLHTWPARYRKLIGAFVIVALTGFVIGAVFIEVTTRLTPEGVVAQYKGLSDAEMESASEMKFPKSPKEMLTTTHNHILGLSVLFVVLGFLYLHTGTMTRLRMFIAVEPLFALITTFGGLWIVRYLWTPFVYVVILSGTLMVVTVLWMGYRILSCCYRGEHYRAHHKTA